MRSESASAPLPVLAAWAIHAFTASGAVLSFLAYRAVEAGDDRTAFLWLGAALLVDGIDGTLARLAGVRDRVPEIDGTVLDLVVDYLTYVFIPAIMIARAGLIAPPFDGIAVAAILLSSLYTFARTDMKTGDNYFRGFPALWNIVAFYLVILRPGAEASLAIVALFVVLTFAPVHVVHPIRVRAHRTALAVLTGLWAVGSLALIVPSLGPLETRIALALSLGGIAGMLALGALRTLRGR